VLYKLLMYRTLMKRCSPIARLMHPLLTAKAAVVAAVTSDLQPLLNMESECCDYCPPC
jgi:hypothetical protein